MKSCCTQQTLLQSCIDNNEDGTPDNTCVTAILSKLGGYVSMYNKAEGNSVEINQDPLDEAGGQAVPA